MLEFLLGGDEKLSGVKFLGEVTVVDLIDGATLATTIGLIGGVVQYSTEPWLKFEIDGKLLYMAKKPFRHSITWNQINAVGAIFGEKVITLQSQQFKVRVLKGSKEDPTTALKHSYDHPGTYGSEWNRLFYPIIGSYEGLSGEGIVFGSQAKYSDADLLLSYTTGNGCACWCQEAQGVDRVWRGHEGAKLLYSDRPSYTSAYYGWRPVLELVE